MTWYRMHRGWLDHPMFDRDEHNDRSVMAWLIEHAAFQPTTVNIHGKPVALKRGQLCHSVRFLAEKWGWHRRRAERAIERFKKWGVIDTESGTGRLVITICNYDKYQQSRTQSGEQEGQDAGEKRGDKGTQSGELKGQSIRSKEGKNINGAIEASPEAVVSFEKFWTAYPRRSGSNPKKPARQKFLSAMRGGQDPEPIIAGATRYRQQMEQDGKLGTEYVAQAQTWLNQERWLDQDPTPPDDPLAAWMR